MWIVFLTVLRTALPLVGGFFTSGFSLVWSFLSSAWSAEIGRTIIIGVGVLLGGYVWGFSHEHAAKIAAVEAATHARDVEWSKEIAAANAKNEARIQEALNAAKAVHPVSPDASQRVRECPKVPSCRLVKPRRDVQASGSHL